MIALPDSDLGTQREDAVDSQRLVGGGDRYKERTCPPSNILLPAGYCALRPKGGLNMKRSIVLAFAALIGSTALVQAQGLLQAIVTPEKAVGVVNQAMEGTWLSEIRPAGLPAAA